MNMSERFPGEMLPVKVVPLTQGKVAITDPEDWELISQYKWHAARNYNTYYARRSQNGVLLSMHKLITGYPQTDHKNGNGLDNRRSNLREASCAQNGANKRWNCRNTSGHIGVTWVRQRNEWRVKIRKESVQLYSGTFDEYQDAVDAYHVASREVFGTFAPQCCPGRYHASNKILISMQSYCLSKDDLQALLGPVEAA